MIQSEKLKIQVCKQFIELTKSIQMTCKSKCKTIH